MALSEATGADSVLRRSYAFERFGSAAAVLDAEGVIVETNEAWRLFASLNGADPTRIGPGVSYLDVCDQAANDVESAAQVASGIRRIIRGDRASFELEYPCPSPIDDRWFLLHASAAPVENGFGVVVFHTNITARKRLELRLSAEQDRDPVTGLPDEHAAIVPLNDRLSNVATGDAPLTVLHLHLDGVDTVENDLGRSTARELIAQMIGRASRVLRGDDVLCRRDDDALIVVCTGLDDAKTLGVVRRLVEVITAPFQFGTTEVSLAVAVGIARRHPGSTAASMLVRAASGAENAELHGASRVRRTFESAGSAEPTSTPHLEAAVAMRDTLVAHASDVVMYFELDGTIAWASPATRTSFGLEPKSLVGRSGLEMIHPDDQERVFVEFASITNRGDHVRVEFRVVADDGTIHWIEETATNLVEDPHVGYVVGNLHDITARKRDEAAIRLQSRLLDAAGQAIFAIGIKGEVIYWNQAATRTYGWTAAEALGRRLDEVIQPVTGWEAEARTVQAAVQRGAVWEGEFAVRHKDGREIPMSVTNTPVYDDAEVRIGSICVSSDVTERKKLERDQAQLSAIVKSSSDAIFSTSTDGIVQTWNRAAEELYGWSAEAMIGTSISRTVPVNRRDDRRREFHDVVRGQPVLGHETVRLHADGSEFPVSIAVSPMYGDDDEIVGACAVVRDIAEQLLLRENLEDDRRRLADAQRSAHLGSFEMNFTTGELSWSDELHAILGLPSETEPSTEAFRARIHPDDRVLVESQLSGLENGQQVVDCTHRISRPNGEVRWVVARTSLSCGGGANVVAGTLLDITDRKRLELDLVHQATHDLLTGLPNRTLLHQELDAALAAGERGDCGVGVQLLDVDRFKLMNDSLGHDRGDELLLAIATTLRDAVEPRATVARFGGDTFAIVTPGIRSPGDVQLLANRIRSRLADGVEVRGERFRPSVSIGMVIAKPGDSVVTALRDADTALYRAKELGRNRAEWFDPSLHHEAVTMFELERELRVAIEDGSLYLVYQPVLDLETNAIVSCEALVRWHHPERGELTPDEFIPVAEKTGLIVALGTWVLRDAVSTVANWPIDVHVAVNISPRQLAEPDLLAVVRDTLAEFQVSPSRLVLEVTETAVVEDPNAAARMISALRTLGVRVVIDDFGTGYTSLSFLHNYPVDGLKIDRSFINDLETSAVIVDAIMRIAGAMGMSVIAEGIETSEQLMRLRELGCRYIQGYLVSRPVTPQHLDFRPRFLEAHEAVAC